MVKVNIGGCSSFVKESEYKEYVEKALSAFDVLESETGAGNDFPRLETPSFRDT